MIRLGGGFWAFVPAGLLSAMLAGLFWMGLVASRDPGFALERDYYEKAVGYDREIAQRAQNVRLGWRVVATASPLGPDGRTALVASVSDGASPLSGASVRVEALRNATAARVVDARLAQSGSGEYRADLELQLGGLWEFRLTVERGPQRFTQVVRITVVEGLS